MRLVTYNVNGIRAAQKKGLEEWITLEAPDIFCLQEVKALPEQVNLEVFQEMGYEWHWHAAEKKGYSGVATFTKVKPKNIVEGMGLPKYDVEGRLLRTDFEDFTLINTYFPSGTRGEVRQDYKYDFLKDFQKYIDNLKQECPKLVICGDVNICHKPIDIHNPSRNKNTSGFLPEEREWVSSFLDSGFVDAFREVNGEKADQYTWWSYRANSRAKNLGWRIDYFWLSENMKGAIADCLIRPEAVHSDHCPIRLDLE